MVVIDFGPTCDTVSDIATPTRLDNELARRKDSGRLHAICKRRWGRKMAEVLSMIRRGSAPGALTGHAYCSSGDEPHARRPLKFKSRMGFQTHAMETIKEEKMSESIIAVCHVGIHQKLRSNIWTKGMRGLVRSSRRERSWY